MPKRNHTISIHTTDVSSLPLGKFLDHIYQLFSTYSNTEKAIAIAALRKEGKSFAQIAKILKLSSTESARVILKRYGSQEVK